jgi:DNA-binding winged helix-turn-helix (wHTH) protein
LRREEIYERVWGYAMAHGDRSVDVFVRKLRQKLRAASPRWNYIHTHFGVGYRFAPEPVDGIEHGLNLVPDPADAELDPALAT